MFIAQTTQTANPLIEIIIPLIPWVMLAAFIWFFVLRLQKRQSEASAEQMAITRKHQAALEAKLDRLIDVTEQRGKGG
jgi:preprotein translocase subunit YajC